MLDTSVLLHDHQAITHFKHNNVAVPITVLEELDNFKKGCLLFLIKNSKLKYRKAKIIVNKAIKKVNDDTLDRFGEKNLYILNNSWNFFDLYPIYLKKAAKDI